MIGLFFGDTEFPKKILHKVKEKNDKYIIIDLSKKKFLGKTLTLKHLVLGNLVKFLSFFW